MADVGGLLVPLVTPFDARGEVDLAALERLAVEVLDEGNVVGLKQAVGGLDADTLELLARAPSEFAVLCGDDAFMPPILVMGGAGAIAASAHLCTEHFAALLAAAMEGRVEEARVCSEALLPLVLALFAEPSPAVLKAVLCAEGRIATPDVRMPLGGASAGAVARAVAATSPAPTASR
jgi:4-hydroxy-tetrahydrodipicolinate synthase